MIIRLYCDNQLLDQWWRSSHFSNLSGIPKLVRKDFGMEVYNRGYLACTPYNHNGTEWFRCDLIPVRQEEVPKELLVLELLNPS